MKQIYKIIFLLFIATTGLLAQNNDCIDALPICTTSSQNFPSGNSGSGTADPGLNVGCATESQSSWYYFTVTTGGMLTFVIDPVNNTTDYDFALYLSPYGSPANPATDCNGSNELGSPVRCNFSGTTGNTGLSTTATNASESSSGSTFSSALTVTTGQVYYLMINNYSGDGYPFSFYANTGNTAVLSCAGVTVPTSPCTCTTPTCANAFHATESAATSENSTVTTGADCTLFSPVIPVEQDGSTDMTFCTDYTIPAGTTLAAFTTGGQFKYVSGGSCTGSIINRSVYASGSCATALTPTGNVTSGGFPIYAVTPGSTYVFCQTIRLAGPDCLQYNSSCINVFTVPAPPANDQCAGAVAISCNSSSTGNTINATTTNDPTVTCNGETVDAPGVWYTFTTATNQTVTLDTDNGTTNFDTKIHVYTAASCAGPFTCVTADDDTGTGTTSKATFGATAGTTYYVLVNGVSGATGNFALDVACATVPANDDCNGAIPLVCGVNVVASNATATSTDPQDGTTCGGFTIGANGHGMWYKLAGNGKIVTLSTELTSPAWDTEISVFTGNDCSSLVCVGGSDDGGTSLRSIFTFTAEVGVTYYVLITGHAGATGTFTLQTTCVDPAYNVGGGTAGGGTAFCNNNTSSGSTTALPTNILVITAPSGTLRDPGGTGNYTNSFQNTSGGQTGTTVICPNGGDGGTTTLTFNSFSTQSATDYVYVYDGPNYNYAQVSVEAPATIGSPYSGVLAPFSITSTNATGCLTVEFYSNASTVSTGFEATWTSTGNTGIPLVANDACNDAISVGIECPTVSGTNINATASCLDPTPSFFSATTLENTVWYKFFVSAADAGSTVVTLSNINCPDFANTLVAAASRGLQYGIYDAGLTDVCPIASINSTTRLAGGTATNPGPASSTAFTTVAGHYYYIGIDGNGGSSCDFDITIDRYATNFAVNSATGGSYSYTCDAAPAQTADVALTLSGGRTTGYSVTVVPSSISVTNSGSVYTLNNIPDGTTWTATATDGLCTQIISGTYDYNLTCNPCPTYSKNEVDITPATPAVCAGATVAMTTAVDATRSVPTVRAATLGGRKYGDGVGGTAPLNYVADYKKYIQLLPFSTMNATTIGTGVSDAQINGLDFTINAKWNDMYIALKNTSCAGSVVIWNGVNNTAFAGGTDATISTGSTTLTYSAATGLFTPNTSINSYSSIATLAAMNTAFAGCNPQGFYLEFNDQSSAVLQYSINNFLFSVTDKTTTAITPTNTLTNITWVGSGAATGGNSGSHTNIAELTLSNSDKNATFTAPPCAGPGSCVYNYTITGKDVNGCTVTGSATITVNPIPDITLSTTNANVCSGTTSTTLVYTATTNSPDQYSIDYNAAANTAGFVDVTNATLPASPITLTVPAGAAAGTYNATLTVRNSTTGCVSAATAITVTIFALPAPPTLANASYCIGATATALDATTTGATGYLWSNAATTASITPSTASAGTTIYTVNVTGSGGCTATRSATITVSAIGNNVNDITLCAGAVASSFSSTASCPSGFVNSGTTISGTFTAATDPIAKRPTTSILNTSTCSFDGTITRNYVATQFQVSVTGNYVFEMNDNTGYDGMGYIVSGAFVPGTCPGTGAWVRGDDDDATTANEPRLGASGVGSGTMSLTAGTTYTLISTTYGSTSGTVSGAFGWTITPPAGGQIMLNSVGAVEWYTVATGGTTVQTGTTFNPINDAEVLAAGAPYSSLNNTNTPGVYTFYTACTGSTCREAVTYTINAKPVIAAGLTQAICSGTAASRTITLSTDLAGTETFAWGIPTMTAGVTGGAAGSGSSITDVLSNSGTTAGTATYTVTVTADAADGGCTNTANVVITVNPVPVITSGLTAEACSGVAVSRSITLSTDPSGTETYSWAAPVNTGGMTGGTSGTVPPITGTFTNNTASPQTATYTVVVTGASAVGSCTSSRDVVITVNPLPTVNAGSDVAICNGGSAALSAAGSGGTGALSYSWTPTATLMDANTATPTAMPTTTTTYIVTVSDTKLCSATDNVQVTVNAVPTATAAATNVTCAGSVANADGKITISGFTLGTDKYDYTTGATYSGSATYTTATLIPAGGVIVSNLTNPAVSQQYTVRIFSSSNSGCYIDRTVTLTNANCICPTINLAPTTAAACAGSANISFTQTGGATGGTWTIDSPMSGGGSIVAATGVYSPPATVASPTTVVIKYSEPSPSNCFGTHTITINPVPAAPTATVTAQPTCATATGTITVTAPAAGAGITYTVTGTSPVVAAVSNATGIFSGLAAGDYEVTTSANGCTSSPISLTVNAQPATPSAPTATVTAQPTCATATGTITVTAPAAGAGITYTVTGTSPVVAAVSNATGIFSGLAAGDYEVTTSANGCTSSPISLTVNAQPATPSAPTATVTAQPTCATATGTITVTAPAAGAGITYTVTGTSPVVAAVSNATGIFSGLAAGDYEVTTSANGCTSSPISLTVNDQPATPSAPTATVTAQPTCATATGTITVTAPAAGAGITYTVTGTSPVVAAVSNATGIFSGLAAGDYEVTTSANGCTSSPISLTVNAQPATPSAPTATVTAQPTCATATGTITVTAPAAGAGITYTVTGTSPVVAAVSNATGIFSGLAAGDYEVTTSANGCTSSPISLTVNAQPATPSAPTATVTAQPTCTTATGTITVTAPAAGAGITYTVTGTSPVVAAVSNATGIFSGLAAGDYEVTTSANGCTSSPISLTVNAQPATPSAPTATVTAQPTCTTATGTITVTAPAAGAGITYTVTGTSPVVAAVSNATGIFSGLAAGDYEVTTSANGCTSSPISLTVNAQPATPSAPTATVTAQPTCATATGTITVTAPAAGAGITYTVTGTSPVVAAVSNATGIFSGLAAGDYEVTTSANGCTSSPISLTVNDQPATPSAPTATVTAQPTCATATGTITVTAPAAGAGITYTVTGTSPVVAAVSNATGIFSGLAAGDYEVTTSANGCTSSPISLTVNAQPATPSAPTATVTAQPTCATATGTITVTAPAAGAGITYTVTGTSPVVAAVSNATGIFSGLAAGDYEVTTSANGCTSSPISLTVNAQPATPSAPTATVTAQPTCATATGTITVTAPAAGAGITYTVTGTSPVVAAVSNATGIFSGLAAGDYEVTTSANGCTSSPISLTVNAQPATPSIASTPTTCTGSTYTITVNATVSSGTLEYSIDGGAYQTSNTFTALANGSNHSVTVRTLGTTCTATATGITATCACAAPPAVSITETTLSTCGTTSVTINYSVTNGPATLTSTGTGTFSTTTLADGTGTATYTPSAGDAGTTVMLTATIPDPDGGGICASASDMVTVVVNARPNAAASVSGAVACGGNINLTATPTGAASYSWAGTGGYTANVQNPVRTTAAASMAGTYTVTITGTNGCTATATTSVTVGSCSFVFRISDPCSCRNNATTLTNGQFNEVVTVLGPAGFVVRAENITGLYQMSSTALVTVPFSTPVTMTYNGSTGYSLQGVHVDDVGYTVIAAVYEANGITPVDVDNVTPGVQNTMTIMNKCAYPNPDYAFVSSSICSHPNNNINLSALITNSSEGSGTATFSGTGVSGSTFSSTVAGIGGPYPITMTYTGTAISLFVDTDNDGTADANSSQISPDGTTPAYPGCIQTVMKSINVINCCGADAGTW